MELKLEGVKQQVKSLEDARTLDMKHAWDKLKATKCCSWGLSAQTLPSFLVFTKHVITTWKSLSYQALLYLFTTAHLVQKQITASETRRTAAAVTGTLTSRAPTMPERHSLPLGTSVSSVVGVTLTRTATAGQSSEPHPMMGAQIGMHIARYSRCWPMWTAGLK